MVAGIAFPPVVGAPQYGREDHRSQVDYPPCEEAGPTASACPNQDLVDRTMQRAHQILPP